jgi:hypothetical protein
VQRWAPVYWCLYVARLAQRQFNKDQDNAKSGDKLEEYNPALNSSLRRELLEYVCVTRSY